MIKIKLPKNKIGCGLSIEHFSLMEFEQEILLPPAKYKLIDNIDTVYNHIDDNVDKVKPVDKVDQVNKVDNRNSSW